MWFALIFIIILFSIRGYIVYKIRNELEMSSQSLFFNREKRKKFKSLLERYSFLEMLFLYPLYWNMEGFYGISVGKF